MQTKKLPLLIVLLGCLLFGLHTRVQGQNNGGSLDFLIELPTSIPSDPISGYMVLQFDTLPPPDSLGRQGIHPVQYVSKTTIVARLDGSLLPQNISGLTAFGEVPPALKLSHISGFQGPVIIEGYPGEPFETLPILLRRSGIIPITNSQIHGGSVLVDLNQAQLEALAEENVISWFHKAPAHVLAENPTNYCPGAASPYGPMAKFVLIGDGWDGPGRGCSQLTYYFGNGTSDISGFLEWDDVRDALAEYNKYVYVDFTETNTPNLPNSLDFDWYTGDHCVDPFGLGVVAHAFPPFPNMSEPLAGDVHFNDLYSWYSWSAPLIGQKHVFAAALHEIGHSLGLDHSADPSSVMFANFDPTLPGLQSDDIAGLRSLYKSRHIVYDDNDRMFTGDVNGDEQEDLVMVNTSYNGGAIRSVDVVTGATIKWIDHDCSLIGWMDDEDRMGLADQDGNGTKELVMINTDYTDGAIRVVDLLTGVTTLFEYHGPFGGWMDPTDKYFFGDVNNDEREELILVNTNYAGGAIMAVDLQTGAIIATINHGTFGGWMDPNDKMTVGDVNGNGKTELILTNNSYTLGAIRVVEITTGNDLLWLNHTGLYNGWMDPTDRMTVGDVNGDNNDDLILVNTSYTGGAILTIDLQTGNMLSWINHGPYLHWMDNCDRLFVNDVDGTGGEDMVMVNTGYSGGAIYAMDLMTGAYLSYTSHGTFGGWMEGTDRMFCPDIDNAGGDLLLVNTKYAGGAIRSIDLKTTNQINWIWHGSYRGWMDGTGLASNCSSHSVFKQAQEESELGVQLQTEKWTLFPNPSQGLVDIQGPSGAEKRNVNVQVFNANGQVVFQRDKKGEEFQMDLSSLPKGMYFVKILSGDQNSSHRLILQ